MIRTEDTTRTYLTATITADSVEDTSYLDVPRTTYTGDVYPIRRNGERAGDTVWVKDAVIVRVERTPGYKTIGTVKLTLFLQGDRRAGRPHRLAEITEYDVLPYVEGVTLLDWRRYVRVPAPQPQSAR